MKVSPISVVILLLLLLILPACQKLEAQHSDAHHAGGQHSEAHYRIVATRPGQKDVTSTEEYVCQIHSRRHIEVRALERGYLEEITVNEGQAVHEGELMFRIVPTLYQARLDAERAEAELAQIEFNNTQRLYEQNVISQPEVTMAKAKLEKARANVNLALAELNFTEIKAPFDGIINRLHEQLGSLIEEGDQLTTLSDNLVMWVYFNVPEASYLDYMAGMNQDEAGQEDDDDLDDDEVDDDDDLDDDDADDDDLDDDDDDDDDDEYGARITHGLKVELLLANGETFNQTGEITAIEADFNNETGNIAFRADFPNPEGLLRHGQTGTVLINTVIPDAIVIPQRATYEVLDKRYVYVVGDDDVVHQREIKVRRELEDVFVIKSGLEANDRIVLEGVRQVTDGEKIEYDFIEPEEALQNLKYHAE